MGRLADLAAAASLNGWELLETPGGPRYTRWTPSAFGIISEEIDVYTTTHPRPRFHHAWYTRQTPDVRARNSSAFVIIDARYDCDQFEDVMRLLGEQA